MPLLLSTSIASLLDFEDDIVGAEDENLSSLQDRCIKLLLEESKRENEADGDSGGDGGKLSV